MTINVKDDLNFFPTNYDTIIGNALMMSFKIIPYSL